MSRESFVCLSSYGQYSDDLTPYLFWFRRGYTLVSPVADYDPLTMIQHVFLHGILFLAD